MSRTYTAGRKRILKGKASNEQTKEIVMPDISKYLVKVQGCDEDCAGVKVSIPCPDDAALPSSTLINSLCKNPDCFIHKGENSTFKNATCCNSSGNVTAKISTKSSDSSINTSKKKIKKPTLVIKNTQITDYFPVRRSNRKLAICKMTERNLYIEDAVLSGKEEGFEVKEFPDKGRGVITTRAFKRGEFVLEYYGDLIDYEEAKRREGIYADKENVGCYMYYFKHRNKQFCIDATKETTRLGRLVNHSKKGNLRTRTFLIKESPHLILFASRDIQPGEELSYDYGDRRREALQSHPWLAS